MPSGRPPRVRRAMLRPRPIAMSPARLNRFRPKNTLRVNIAPCRDYAGRSRAREEGMFKRIDHVEIVTDRPQETEAFYTGILGFRVKGRDRVAPPGQQGGLDLVYLELGGTVVELITFRGQEVA